jgi:4-carboxymuconolactone decarboxylase
MTFGEPDTTLTDRYSRGLKALQDVEDAEIPSVLTNLADLAPDLARFTVEFGYGDIFDRPGLGRPERQLATLGALAAMGNAAPQLKFHTRGALNVGCTPTQIVEALMHVCLYAGFPATLNALTVAKEVFAERGVTPDLTPRGENGQSRYDQGWALLSEVDGEGGHNVVNSLKDIAPDLGRYLIEFAFGDIYPRAGLDLRLREVVTVAACTALGTVTPQLKVHVHGLLNVGGTQTELIEIITQMSVYAGFPAALNALAAAREVLAERAVTDHRKSPNR